MPTPEIAKAEAAIVEMTNEFRGRNGLGAVVTNQMLVNTARAYAAYLARTATFSHSADGRQPADRARAAGYRYCHVAENLALNLDSRGFESRDLARQMVEGWINSPGHRRNLLGAHSTEIGVAIAQVPDKHPKYVSVQMFGRPITLSYSFQIANVTRATVSYTFGEDRHDLGPALSVTHTACSPASVVFAAPVRGAKGAVASYEAKDGQIFTLEAGARGEVAVKVGTRERLR